MGRGVSRGRNPARAPPKEPLDSAEQRVAREQRGREELFDVRREMGLPFLAFRVSNPLRGTRYTVHWPAHPAPSPLSCDCADYAHRGLGVCKHIEAVRLWAKEHPDELEVVASPGDRIAATALWQEIDRRGASQSARAYGPASLRWAERPLLAYPK
ncbi:MAG: hypothetical protein L3K07_07875 [Thermoplasmata archaeon]|nr:hypothetical protein [Thermoplasmata archaeon]